MPAPSRLSLNHPPTSDNRKRWSMSPDSDLTWLSLAAHRIHELPNADHVIEGSSSVANQNRGPHYTDWCSLFTDSDIEFLVRAWCGQEHSLLLEMTSTEPHSSPSNGSAKCEKSALTPSPILFPTPGPGHKSTSLPELEPSSVTLPTPINAFITLQLPYHSRRRIDGIEMRHIQFHVKGRPGFPLREALNGNFRDLDLRDDPFITTGAVSCYLLIFGYKPWYRQFKTNNWCKPPSPITLAKLAKEIAKSVDKFILEHAGAPIDKKYLAWRVGDGYINVDRLTLVGFKQLSHASWQPELALLS